jgi:CMP-N-acetylneuraminic acid synthetase
MDFADATILTTDDPQIAQEGERFGLSVPFLRPASLSRDEALTTDVWRHAWLEAERVYACTYDISILLEPTSPLRRIEDIERALDGLLSSGADCSFTVSPTPAHFTPEKALKVGSDMRIDHYLSSDQAQSLRQKIPAYVHRNGICYVVRRRHLVDNGLIVTPGSLSILIERHVVNIDEPYELELANWLFDR